MIFVRFTSAEKIDPLFPLPRRVGDDGAEQVRAGTEVRIVGIEALQIAADLVMLKQRIERRNQAAVQMQTVQAENPPVQQLWSTPFVKCLNGCITKHARLSGEGPTLTVKTEQSLEE